ncbi:adenine phosphoribosyltransferase [Corynebacterium pseudopelargi]|nr:adenine phosphoribosyltransferase [Corynebacterium pseudopelargi]
MTSNSPRYTSAIDALKQKTRLVPDFPVEGVLFEDLTPVLADPEAFRLIIDDVAAEAAKAEVDLIGGLDARGFLLGSAVAYCTDSGILAIRKQGKLPPPVHTQSYDLEYGKAALELPAENLDLTGKRVMVVDDVLATGGTLSAAIKLIEQCGGEVVGCAVVLEVAGLGGRERLGDVPLYVVNQQNTEG